MTLTSTSTSAMKYALHIHIHVNCCTIPIMHILHVHVHVHVKQEQIEAFKQATIENAQGSVQEPGVARFDVMQYADDPTRFILIEHYKAPEDQIKHRETPHYQKWRDTVADMMAEPRTAVKVVGIYPEI